MSAATRETGVLGEAAAYHMSTGGGRWRAELAVRCGEALTVIPDDCARLGAACELVHQASIVHDDVQDDSATRRNRPSVAARYGSPIAICVGDHLLSRAFSILAPLPYAQGLVGLFADRVTEMAAAQAEEFSPTLWQGMTRARYSALAAGKAGAMVALSVESGALLGGLTGADLLSVRRASRLLGTAYQACDDIEDLTADLSRGALNGVIALALEARDSIERDRLLKLLAHARQPGLDRDEADAGAKELWAHAAQLSAWARGLLAEAVGAVDGHPLAPVLIAAARDLGAGMPVTAEATKHAA
jgi:geranylgeranyl diphosphate synthase type II